MSLRIVREEVYLPLVVDEKHISAMHGGKSYTMPLADVWLTEHSEEELRSIEKGEAARCLIIKYDNDRSDFDDLDVVYSGCCVITTKGDTEHLHVMQIDSIKLDLCLKGGRIYQR